MSDDEFLNILNEAKLSWKEHQSNPDILKEAQFFERYDKIKEKLWPPQMSSFIKEHAFTKTMVYAHYMMVCYNNGIETHQPKRPHLRVVH